MTTTNDRERSEFGSLRLRRTKDKDGNVVVGTIYWLRYRVDGKEHWESSRSTSRRQAEKLLQRRAAELEAGLFTAPEARRLSFGDLEEMIRTYYRAKGRRSLGRLEGALSHLRETFGASRAHAITADRIAAYELERLDAGAARATVNYELAALRRAFKLALEHRRLAVMPKITIREPKNARAGFFEPDDFAAVLAQLPVDLQPVMRFAYLTGWRVRSEVLPLTWDRVDFAAGVVRLEVNTTKSDDARTFPFDALPELAALLRAQRAATTALERAEGRIIPHVFHRGGKAIRSYHNAWDRAIARAARGGSSEALAAITRPQLAGRIVHDFRRTAVRNLVRAGVDEHLAMKLTGHKTRAIFDRYDIVNEADLRAGVGKLAAHMAAIGGKAKRGRGSAKGTTGGQSPIQRIGGAAG
jgi:site-specific recombinase XerD